MDNDGRPLRKKRRACDLCCVKKIKCDKLEPECSNCLLYKTECTSGNSRDRANLPKRKATNDAFSPSRASNKRVRTAADGDAGSLISDSVVVDRISISDKNKEGVDSSSRCQLWKFDQWEPKLYHGPPDTGLPSLPPLETALPIIENYFRVANQAIPLFTQASFMRLVSGWYQNKNPKRDKPICAAMLVVVALGLGYLPSGSTLFPNPHERTELESFCMRNAQGIIWDLTTSSDTLIVVQTMLGLVMLYCKCSDFRPAGMLLSVAMRMAQRLHLHASSPHNEFAVHETNERMRVFWVAYILDREISLRSRMPPVHCDTDVDVPLPTGNPAEEYGSLWSSNGSHELYFFRLRAELARIQGKIYNELFSSQALKIAPVERRIRVGKLDTLLSQWYSQIPPSFRLEDALEHAGEVAVINLTSLYHVYLTCIISTHGVYSRSSEWLQKVGSLSRAAIEDFAVALKGSHVAPCTLNPDPPLPSAWDRCVDISRSTMMLFQIAELPELSLWQCTCSHFSALVILLANILIRPSDKNRSADLKTATASVKLADETFHITDSPVYQSLHRVIMDLYQRVSDNSINEPGLPREAPTDRDQIPLDFEFPEQIQPNIPQIEDGSDIFGIFDPGAILGSLVADEGGPSFLW